MPILLDPNILYIVLVIGLWLGVTALYVPGTGALEVLSLGTVIVSIIAFLSVSTNWLAVLALVVGILGFMILPFWQKGWRYILIGGVILQVYGSITLFHETAVSPILIAFVIAVSLAYHYFLLIPILKSQKPGGQMTDDAPIEGEVGFVQRDINTVGTVRVRGETWTARSEVFISAGEQVVVVDQDGLTLHVEPLKHKHHDEEVFVS